MTPRELGDERDRRRIRDDLEANLLVEAGAGSGKTTSLVERMLGLVRRAVPVESVAAVTFTRKAAAELRERFEELLEHEARARAGSPEGLVLARALAERDRTFIGTIHAFAGRLLREHPLEAGLDPTFEEVDEEAWPALRQRFWTRWLERMRLERDPALDALRTLGLDPRRLAEGFGVVTGQPDVEFPAPAVPAPDPVACRRALRDLLARSRQLLPGDEPEAGWDDLQRTLRRLTFLERTRDWSPLPTFAEIVSSLTASNCKVTQNRWPDRKAARDLGLDWIDFVNGVAAGFLTGWREHCYPAVMAVLARAARDFERERRRTGQLNFEDLLLGAARLLRGSARARRALGERFRYLLVDEFQDTDPVQAEVCLLLASDPDEGLDWREVTPRPGALFVVGDPKQSIYRFRRADIQTYELVKRRFEAFGGVLSLTSNFRSVHPIATLVDAHFEAVFPAVGSEIQAPFAPLATQLPPVGPDGVHTYLSQPDRNNKAAILQDDAARVASAIAARVASGLYQPSDFLVLTFHKQSLAAYAQALSARNVPVAVTGAPLAQERELLELLVVLRALADPANPVLVTAALEGLCFGASVADLDAARMAGVTFAVSERAEGTGVVAAALQDMHAWWRLSRQRPPDLLVEHILDRTGLLSLAAGGSLGDARAGALLHVVSLLREESTRAGLTLAGAIDVLEAALEFSTVETPLRPGRTDAVRVMNLHKAKGLEARVVFLAAPVAVTDHPPTAHVSRGTTGRATGGLLVCADDMVLAQPVGWKAMAAQEAAFVAAERERLLYVATTRAERELVVAQLDFQNKTGPAPDRGFWAPLAPSLHRHATPLSLGIAAEAGRPPLDRGASELAGISARAAERRELASRSHVEHTTVTRSLADERQAAREGGGDAVGWHDDGVVHGATWGRLVHAGLEAMGRGRRGESLARHVRALVCAEAGPAQDEVDETVQRVLRVLEQVERTPEWRAVQDADAAWFELPVMRAVTEDGITRLIEGVADVAYRTGDELRVLDWKSDRADEASWERRAAGYEAQAAAYAEIIAAKTGLACSSAVIRTGGS